MCPKLLSTWWERNKKKYTKNDRTMAKTDKRQETKIVNMETKRNNNNDNDHHIWNKQQHYHTLAMRDSIDAKCDIWFIRYELRAPPQPTHSLACSHENIQIDQNANRIHTLHIDTHGPAHIRTGEHRIKAIRRMIFGIFSSSNQHTYTLWQRFRVHKKEIIIIIL